ncbi:MULTISPECIES: TetR/AcrR family transcriptional regulator [Bacillus]|uniref:TetR/AcrR family transcriptional regulator n=1 Tax=Bacillus glycinifermentans TaxID=1664069 RepID=A0AAJ4D1A7_9BACI|nr:MULTISPECIES: TetR/AcrR family transcriptional regulator [Bacillus]KKB72517.1 TetR family transcriptional regulator [Bacillus sp. TH008]MBU8786551.1 TetR/AcrR family transcriptional regulator [Bacillus glycinifermentans]MDU0073188.1 TetR/AcrR family transcriptional regulator [Bacillus sp. IG6]MED8021025.1 TetR/AcrR family transcriptional regulator [Bacillus glycinifermentans]NUJ16472.1 TetR/AcrR family transcriptional regulator [Bacillus glycinifermentans]
MPLQLYDKEQIFDACLAVFARRGYSKTSTGMLAEAAGVSKALIFHHFKSKKDLYLSLLDYCIDKVKTYLSIDDLLQCGDFFEAKEKASLAKIEFFKKHPDAYKLTMETFRTPPSELKEEIAEMYGEQFAIRDRLWRELFAKVPLREGVDREEAFELIMLANEHFERKFLSEIAEDREFDEDYNRRLLDERNRFLNMIRFGIER